MTDDERCEADELYEYFQTNANDEVKLSPTARNWGRCCCQLAYAAALESKRTQIEALQRIASGEQFEDRDGNILTPQMVAKAALKY